MNSLESIKINIIQQLINTNDIKLLDSVQKVIDNDKSELSNEQFITLNRRRENHLNKKSQSYSWDEVKKKLSL